MTDTLRPQLRTTTVRDHLTDQPTIGATKEHSGTTRAARPGDQPRPAINTAAEITDGRGNTTTYTYDKIDRKLSTGFSTGLTTVSNTYNTAGQQLTSISAAGTISNTYDQLGRLLTTVNTAGGGTETYTYDRASNLATTTDGLGTITNSYDASGVLLDMKYPHNGSFQHLVFTTDDQGRRTDQYLQADSTGTYWAGHVHTTYDTTGRISGLNAATGQAPTTVTPVLDMSYCYNTASPAPTCATGNTTDRSKLQWQKDNLTGQTTTFSYDSGGRLLTVGQSGGQTNNTYTYTYDADGNRKTAVVTGSNPATQSLTFNPANQITTTGYSYDGAGNLTATPTASYTYNGAEQMTQAITGGVTSTYTYAGASQSEVLSETRGGSSPISTKLVYGRTGANGQPEIEQYSINGNQAYVFDDPTTGQPLGIVTSADQACMLVFDGTDNPVGLLTNSATVSFTYKYDPWGVQTLTAGGTGNGAGQNPYAFHGGIKDPGSGLVKFGLRWYNPVTGTWTQQDTLDSPLDPANANRYAYAGDDPVNNIDPSGQYLSACTTQAINLAIGAIVLGIGYGGALAAVAAGITAPAGIAAIVTLGSGTGLLLTGYNDYLRDCT
jgi:RHS repeat-associated protein